VYRLDYSEGLRRARGVLQNVQWGEVGTATWVPAPSLNLPRCGLTVFADEAAGALVAVGGIYEDTVATVEVLANVTGNSTAPAWVYGPPLAVPRYYAATAAVHAPPGPAGAAWHAARAAAAAAAAGGGGAVPVAFVSAGDGYAPSKDYGPYLNSTALFMSAAAGA
jgi:hypothetical protein